MKQVVAKYREKRKELYVEFMIKFVEKHCEGCCLNVELIKSVNILYYGSRTCVRLVSRVKKYFELRRGLR